MGRDSIIARSFMRKLCEHKEDFQDIDTNKKINILDFDTFFKIKKFNSYNQEGELNFGCFILFVGNTRRCQLSNKVLG